MFPTGHLYWYLLLVFHIGIMQPPRDFNPILMNLRAFTGSDVAKVDNHRVTGRLPSKH